MSKNLRSFISLYSAKLALLLTVTATGAMGAKNNHAKSSNAHNEVPVLLQADAVNFDEKTQAITAAGHVLVSQGPRLISADKLQYFKQEDKIVASGHVWLRDEEGNYSFFTHAELKNKMGDGFVENIKVLLEDDSRAAGRKAKRIGGERVIVWQGVYSPCNICRSDPDSVMLWQLKSDKIIHDKSEKVIVYHHAWMEFLNIPVFYFPYFFHPDPSVKRKSGVLAPEYATDRDFGFAVTVPVFWAIDNNKDLTAYLTASSKVVGALAMQYRHRLVNGEYDIDGSILNSSNARPNPSDNPDNFKYPNRNRWHLFANARYEFDDSHLLTIKVRRVSDLTYLHRFSVFRSDEFAVNQGTLTSAATLERFKDTHYGVIQGYVFQADVKKITPLVLPTAHLDYETLPGNHGETWMVNADFLHLNRDRDILGLAPENLVRGSIGVGGQFPYVSSWGDIWQLKFKLRGDVYYFRNYQPTPTRPESTSNQQRFFPQVSLNWRYPFVKYLNASSWVVEPAAMLVASPQGGNTIEVPNEDSTVISLDRANIFLESRIHGIDRVDSGYRFVYGLHNRYFFGPEGKASLFVGQSVRLDGKQILTRRLGENRNYSDLVFSARFSPYRCLDFTTRFLLDPQSGNLRTAESTATIGTPFATMQAAHYHFSKETSYSGKPLSQLYTTIKTPKLYNWEVGYFERRNLKGNGRIKRLENGAFVNYHNECLITTLVVSRQGYRDRDLRPDTRVVLRFSFKNLGTFSPVNIKGIMGETNKDNKS